MLGHTKRVLMVGAHPDDEDTELLTILVRGEGAEAAYLSLTRGEGGQNLIGPELGQALGLIRTEELLAARRVDGARQFFTRAYDFGFSKNLDDTWAHWPRDSVLKDVVRIVRRFRPQIVVPVFSGTPQDGHGQHQASAWAAIEAFRVAGDPTRFPELEREEGLAAWTPQKLYRSTRFDTAATTLTLDGGVLDPAVGKTFHQIAMESRSRHRSQDMGRLQDIGPSTVRLRLIEDRTGKGAAGLFAGIDTSVANGESAAHAERARAERARAIRSGVLCDAVADDARVVPGQRLRVAVTCHDAARTGPHGGLAIGMADGQATAHGVRTLPRGGVRRDTLEIVVPERLPPTRPYFLASPLAGAMYRWPTREAAGGEPFAPPPLVARFGLVPPREVTFRTNDQATGEVRRPLVVVPRVDVKLDPDTLLWPVGREGDGVRRFTVTLRHGAKDTTSGRVLLELPAGWAAVAPRSFTLAREDEVRDLVFEVRPPAGVKPGAYEIAAVALDARGVRYDLGVYGIDYPHIRPRWWTAPARARVVVAPLALPKLARVGYVRGAADRVPEALRSVGVPVELLDARALERGDLSRYDAIVVGPRAYETDAALVANNGRLLAYAREGGLLLVQYQQYQFVEGGFAPFPLRIPRPHARVTDERAPVTAAAGAPVLAGPNAIGAGDWEGWVQERSLYMPDEWADAYRAPLEMHDPGEAAQRGALLVTPLGRGTYVYTGLSFFRQLPAGVPGAYRLFLNLLALRPAPAS